MFEGYAVAYKFECAAVDADNVGKGEIFLTFARCADCGLYDVALTQSISLDLGHGDIYIVGRRKIIEIGAAEEPKTFRNYLKYACGFEDAVEIISRGMVLLLLGSLLVLLAVLFIFFVLALLVWLERLWKGTVVFAGNP